MFPASFASTKNSSHFSLKHTPIHKYLRRMGVIRRPGLNHTENSRKSVIHLSMTSFTSSSKCQKVRHLAKAENMQYSNNLRHLLFESFATISWMCLFFFASWPSLFVFPFKIFSIFFFFRFFISFPWSLHLRFFYSTLISESENLNKYVLINTEFINLAWMSRDMEMASCHFYRIKLVKCATLNNLVVGWLLSS